MRAFIQQTKTFAALLSLASVSAHALTVPVSQDATTTSINTITLGTGKGTTLSVNAKQSALVRFNVGDLTVVPASITPSNIKSATLRLYVSSIKPGDLTVHAITSDWTEKPSTLPAAIPTISPTVLATIPSVSVLGKHFITVDVTAQVKAWLTTPATDFGLAIQTATATAKVFLGSKEGPGLGESATLDIEANLAENASGNVSVSGNLSVSNNFLVEARPNNTGAFNNFIGNLAGAANTSGSFNTFVGTNSGKVNTTGDSNAFFGTNAGSTNTTGTLNVFIGQGAGAFNNSGSNNTFVGQAAGFNSFSATDNSFFGWKAGFSTSTGNNNAFFGSQAGLLNTAANNSYFGSGAGATNVTGTQQCFFGINAGNLTTGNFNSFFGAGAGQNTVSGTSNTFLGNVSGLSNTNGSHNTFLGGNTGGSMTAESNNLLVGSSADGAAGITNSTAIGPNAKVTASNSLVLGSISGINGAASSTNVGIGVTAPASTLSVNGSVSVAIRSTNAAISILGASDCVFVFTGSVPSSGANLPNAVGIPGRVYYIKNRGSVAFLLFTILNQTIDGTNNSNSALNIPTGTVVQLVSDGANWIRLN